MGGRADAEAGCYSVGVRMRRKYTAFPSEHDLYLAQIMQWSTVGEGGQSMVVEGGWIQDHAGPFRQLRTRIAFVKH